MTPDPDDFPICSRCGVVITCSDDGHWGDLARAMRDLETAIRLGPPIRRAKTIADAIDRMLDKTYNPARAGEERRA